MAWCLVIDNLYALFIACEVSGLGDIWLSSVSWAALTILRACIIALEQFVAELYKFFSLCPHRVFCA